MKDKKKAKLRKYYWILVDKKTGLPVGDGARMAHLKGVFTFWTKAMANVCKSEHEEPRRVRVEEV